MNNELVQIVPNTWPFWQGGDWISASEIDLEPDSLPFSIVPSEVFVQRWHDWSGL
jgi:hypothetical protein